MPDNVQYARARHIHAALLCFCLFFLCACPVDPARRDFEEASSLLDRGSLREAARRYAFVVTKYPGSRFAPESQLRIAGIYSRLNEFDKAEYAYSALFFMYPESQEALVGREELAMLHSRNREHMKAIEEYQRLFQSLPSNRQRFQYLIAMEYIKMNDFTQARAELVELNNMMGNPALSPRIRLHIAESYYLEGSYNKALEKYDDVIARFPENEAAIEARLAMARIFEEEGDFKKAIASLEEVRSKKELPGLDDRIKGLSRRIKAGRR